jgi:DNA-directed RNA polymerase specialized sigma24 family protein
MLQDYSVSKTQRHNDCQVQQNHTTCTHPDKAQNQHDLILQCYPHIQRHAWRYGYNYHLQPADQDELISIAMVYITEHAEDALTKDNPMVWLLSCAKHQMHEAYCNLSTYNMCSNWYQRKQWGQEQQTVCSLDVLIETKAEYDDEVTSLLDFLAAPSQQTTTATTHAYITLYDALKRLSPTRRKLIAQHYGLNGHGATAIEQLAKSKRKRHLISQHIYEAKRTLAKYIHEAERELVGGAA